MNTIRPKVIWIVRYNSEGGTRAERKSGKGNLGKNTRSLRMETVEFSEEVGAVLKETGTRFPCVIFVRVTFPMDEVL